jgi:hypothetical protein
LNNFKQSKAQEFISSRDLSQNNIDRFCNNLANLDWSNVTDTNDPQSAYNFFCDTFLGLYDIHFPIQRKPFNRNFHGLEKWMSSGILTSRREKNRLCNLSLNDPTNHNINKYKLYRDMYNTVVRGAKKQFFQNELTKNQANLKQTWSIIRLAINKNSSKSSTIPELLINNQIVNDPYAMANHFNEFFTRMPLDIANEINPIDPNNVPEFARNFFSSDPDMETPTLSFSDFPISSQDIIDATKIL